MITNYRLLLKQAAMIYEKHEAGRKEPFNIFTVLRKENDEVNLHSRFLHALLDYQFSDTGRQNLKYFLQRVGIKEFEQNGATVRREYRNIDILLSNNTTKQAVVIENKIDAKDRPAQLWGYHKILQEEEYCDIHLLYLTLDGHDPSKNSVCNLPYQTISYRDNLLPWLKCCQMYACDEPELRESVAQYIHLIRKLTGTDFEEAYRNELKDLLSKFASRVRDDVCQDEAYLNKLKDLLSEGNNFVLAHDLTKNIVEDNNLAHDLNEAVTGTKISLLWKLWCEIESALKNIKAQIPNFSDKAACLSNISEKKVKKYVKGEKGHNNLLLYYRVSPQVHLGVQLDRSNSRYNIYFGILCDRTKYPTKYDKLQKALKALKGRSSGEFPWYKYADEDLNFNTPDVKTLKLLSKKKKRKQFAKGIAGGLKDVWERMKEANLL